MSGNDVVSPATATFGASITSTQAVDGLTPAL